MQAMQTSTSHRTPHSGAGMTLIELIIAIALLALVTVIAYRGLNNLERSNTQLTHETERWKNITLFFSRFGSDVAQPSVRPIHVGSPQPDAPASGASTQGNTSNNPDLSAATSLAAANALMTQNLMAALGGYADISNAPTRPAWQGKNLAPLASDDNSDQAALEFTRKSATGRDEIRVGYRLRGSQLELLIWPALDRAPNTRPAIYPLLDDITSLHLRYFDATGIWQDTWPPNDDKSSLYLLPLGVEIELILRDGTHLIRVFALPS